MYVWAGVSITKSNVFFDRKKRCRMGLEGELGIYRQGHADISPERESYYLGESTVSFIL